MSNPRTPSWRFFPWALALGLGVVVAVNGIMVWSALSSYPGRAGQDGFDLSNRYETVLSRDRAMSGLGWSVTVAMNETHHPVISIGGPPDSEKGTFQVDAVAERLVGPAHRTPLLFRAAEDGRFVADGTLDLPGQWEVTVRIGSVTRDYAVTKRVIVR